MKVSELSDTINNHRKRIDGMNNTEIEKKVEWAKDSSFVPSKYQQIIPAMEKLTRDNFGGDEKAALNFIREHGKDPAIAQQDFNSFVNNGHATNYINGFQHGTVKPSSVQLANGDVLLNPGNTAAALPAEAALRNGHRMPGEKLSMTEEWHNILSGKGPSNLMKHPLFDKDGHLDLNGDGVGGIRGLIKAVIEHVIGKHSHGGARMASNGSFKDLKFEDGSPAAIPKDIEPIDPKTGKTPEPEPAINPLDPRMQPMAMGMTNPTPGMKFA